MTENTKPIHWYLWGYSYQEPPPYTVKDKIQENARMGLWDDDDLVQKETEDS